MKKRIDFVERFYVSPHFEHSNGYDRERAGHFAFSKVIPLLMKEELTPRQSVCLQMKYVNHKSQNEIAELLKLSQPTVSRHITTAKETMNKHLQYCYAAVSAALDEYDREL